jgi:hypothetical protein
VIDENGLSGVELTPAPDGHPQRPKFLKGNSYDWPKPVAEIVPLVQPPRLARGV